MQIERFSERRLNPFMGTVQVVTIAGADAVTRDGRLWSLYVHGAVDEMIDEAGEHHLLPLADTHYATWSHHEGLRRAPVRSAADYPRIQATGNALLAAVEASAHLIPFPLADHYEQWLLDRDGRPLVLLASSVKPPSPRDGERDWLLASQAALALGSGGAAAVADLKASVLAAAGDRRWFLRDSQGVGVALEGGDRLAAAEFPELLLRRKWQDAVVTERVAALLAWQSPWLLQLQRLTRASRDWLVAAASHRCFDVESLCYAYCEVDAAWITAMRVEARMRRAQGESPPTMPASPALFYPYGNE
jgi:hypothetical protein